MLRFIKPQLATLKAKAPKGDQWLHEIKYDGYRVQLHLNSGTKKVYTRNRSRIGEAVSFRGFSRNLRHDFSVPRNKKSAQDINFGRQWKSPETRRVHDRSINEHGRIQSCSSYSSRRARLEWGLLLQR
jgi:ATP dependent DNA ligase domain